MTRVSGPLTRRVGPHWTCRSESRRFFLKSAPCRRTCVSGASLPLHHQPRRLVENCHLSSDPSPSPPSPLLLSMIRSAACVRHPSSTSSAAWTEQAAQSEHNYIIRPAALCRAVGTSAVHFDPFPRRNFGSPGAQEAERPPGSFSSELPIS